LEYRARQQLVVAQLLANCTPHMRQYEGEPASPLRLPKADIATNQAVHRGLAGSQIGQNILRIDGATGASFSGIGKRAVATLPPTVRE